MRTPRAAIAAATLVLPLVVAACYPDQLSDVEDLDTVTTVFDTGADFSVKRTYALVDSVVPIGFDTTGDNDEVPASLSRAVVSEIRTNLNALGWQEITDPRVTEPDVVVAAGVAVNQYIYADWYSYWGYWPYWPPVWAGWGWYYPVPIVYSYDVGTLLVTMVDARRASPTDRLIPIAWIAAVRGVGNGAASNQARAVAGVDQAFEQSPYLTVIGPAPSARRTTR